MLVFNFVLSLEGSDKFFMFQNFCGQLFVGNIDWEILAMSMGMKIGNYQRK